MSFELSSSAQDELSRGLDVIYVLNALCQLYDHIALEVDYAENPKGPVKFPEIPLQDLCDLLENLPFEIMKITDGRIMRAKRAKRINHVEIKLMRDKISSAIEAGREKAARHREAVVQEIEWLVDAETGRPYNPNDKWASFGGLSYEQTQQLSAKIDEIKKSKT